MPKSDKTRPDKGKSSRRTQLSVALRANLKRRKKQPVSPEKRS